MKVLIACEYSGRVREAFRARGHIAMSCDLLPAEDGGVHYQGDVFDVISAEWDLMIAFPPCTYLCASGMHWTTRGKRDKQLTEDAIAFVRRLMDAPIDRIAIENPIGVISTRIKRPSQVIQPWWFGDDASKKTCLWLKGLPSLRIDDTLKHPPRYACQDCGNTTPAGTGWCEKCGSLKVVERWGNQTNSGQNKLAPSDDRWKERSRTYQGIANAMADQWGAL